MPLSYANIAAKTSTNDTAAAPASVDAPVPAPRTSKASVTESNTKAPVPAPRAKDTMGLLPSEPSICIARVLRTEGSAGSQMPRGRELGLIWEVGGGVDGDPTWHN